MKIKHGKAHSTEYCIWQSMIQRCTNPKNMNYRNYGGRGIKVCDSWRESFENFYRHMGDRPSMDYTLDRINNDGHYEPGNCKWSTKEEQVYNRKATLYIKTDNAEILNTKQAMKKYGLKKQTLLSRIKSNIPLDKEVDLQLNNYHYKGQEFSTIELAEMSGLPRKLLNTRLFKNKDVHAALTRPHLNDVLYKYHHSKLSLFKIAKIEGINLIYLKQILNKSNNLIDIALDQIKNACRSLIDNTDEMSLREFCAVTGFDFDKVRKLIYQGLNRNEIIQKIINNDFLDYFDFNNEKMNVIQISLLTGYDMYDLYVQLIKGNNVSQAISKIEYYKKFLIK